VAAVPLPEGLLREAMPRHVAVIMDGNARWARQRGFIALSAGHEAGARSLRELVELCCDWGVRVLTVFAFSYDNWIRPKVSSLPSLFLSFGKYFSSDGVHKFLK
jgi:ditrans,polycis-polyprenyl diphosphate synthase